MSTGGPGHLARRFLGSLSRRPPSPDQERWALDHLSAAEGALWQRMSPQDRRHSIVVAERFVDRFATRLGSTAAPAEVAAALLHDIGKLDAGLGTFGRVAATLWGRVVGRARAEQGAGRFARYLRHEAIGAALLRDAGSDPRTIALVAGDGDPADPGVQALAWADEI